MRKCHCRDLNSGLSPKSSGFSCSRSLVMGFGATFLTLDLDLEDTSNGGRVGFLPLPWWLENSEPNF